MAGGASARSWPPRIGEVMRRITDGVAGSMHNVLSQAVACLCLLVISIVVDGSLRREWVDAKHKYSWGGVESQGQLLQAGSLQD